MSHIEIRKKFLDFFEKNGHKIVPSSSLLPQNDSSVLLTTSGMQQFKPYYLEKESPYGNRVASIQKCFRTSDIDEVGDERHLTFFEMLGNFSFKFPDGENSYFKEEAIKLGYEFITKEMDLEIDYVSVFGGDEKNNIPRDDEAVKIWKKLGMPQEKIKFFGREDNFWGPTGNDGPCGPTTEIYVNGIEIWNIVFNEYYFDGENFEKLKYQGIDTGMGLERLAMAVQKTQTIFETDLFSPIINFIKNSPRKQNEADQISDEREMRIIADHLRGSVFLISAGLTPSNVGAGYILRRILRRTVRFSGSLNIFEIIKIVIREYGDFYPELKNNENKIIEEIEKETEKFSKTLEQGLKELLKIFDEVELFEEFEKFKKIETRDFGDYRGLGKKFFKISSTYGFPIEMIIEEINKLKKKLGFEKLSEVHEKKIKQEFNKEFKKHQEISRHGAENKFGGHGVKLENDDYTKTDTNKITKLHTATHLLQAALRKILGNEVHQMGSDINEERLRFDFSFGRKLTEEELKKVENLVNEKIKENLEVKKEEMKYEDALKSGALAFFKEKYPETVTVYSIHDFSKEICGGPHVKNTKEIGNFKITKEESSSAGVRRIKAIAE